MITAARITFTRMVSTPRAIISRVEYRVRRLDLTLGLLVWVVRTFAEP